MNIEELKTKSTDELVALLQEAEKQKAEKDEIIKQAVEEVALLQLQKDTEGLPVIAYKKKNYQATVHSTTLPSEEGLYAEPTFVKIKELKEKDAKVIERLIKVGALVELK
ncbi:MAG: hypothetical protein ACOVOV_04545 [Dolichospermum sp.]